MAAPKSSRSKPPDSPVEESRHQILYRASKEQFPWPTPVEETARPRPASNTPVFFLLGSLAIGAVLLVAWIAGYHFDSQREAVRSTVSSLSPSKTPEEPPSTANPLHLAAKLIPIGSARDEMMLGIAYVRVTKDHTAIGLVASIRGEKPGFDAAVKSLPQLNPVGDLIGGDGTHYKWLSNSPDRRDADGKGWNRELRFARLQTLAPNFKTDHFTFRPGGINMDFDINWMEGSTLNGQK